MAELNGDVEGDLVVVLITAPSLGLQGVNETGVDEFLDRLARDVAVESGPYRARVSVVLAHMLTKSKLEEVADQIVALGGTADVHPCEPTDIDDIQSTSNTWIVRR